MNRHRTEVLLVFLVFVFVCAILYVESIDFQSSRCRKTAGWPAGPTNLQRGLLAPHPDDAKESR